MKITIELDRVTPELLRLLERLSPPSLEAVANDYRKPPETATPTETPEEALVASETPPEADETPLDAELLDSAVKQATKLLKSGEADRVKAALEGLGLERVSHIADNATAKAFLEAIS